MLRAVGVCCAPRAMVVCVLCSDTQRWDGYFLYGLLYRRRCLKRMHMMNSKNMLGGRGGGWAEVVGPSMSLYQQAASASTSSMAERAFMHANRHN